MNPRSVRTVSIVGARPQFVKLSPVARAMKAASVRIDDLIVHTGQHYDDSMSKVFFDELEIPPPAVNLGIGSASHGAQTARMLESIESYLRESTPDVVIVYGDTNSTLAGALAASKLHIPVAHVEAGLRSFNRRMPEELNRIVTDHLSDALFAPTQTAIANLGNEGLGGKALLTGDVMYDAVLFSAKVARQRSHIMEKHGLRRAEYGVATLHRAENTAPMEMRNLLDAMNAAASTFGRIVFPMHPRTAAALRETLPDWQPGPQLSVIEPLGYLDMLALVQGARWVLTDSGGLQKEAFFLGCPCITLRNETEWIETLENGANRIAGNDGSGLLSGLGDLQERSRIDFAAPPSNVVGPFGNGSAARSIVEAVCTMVKVWS